MKAANVKTWVTSRVKTVSHLGKLAERFELLRESMVQELRWIIRTPLLLLVLVAVPVFYPIIISAFFVHDQAVSRPAILIDDDNSAYSRQLISNIDAAQEIEIIKRSDSIEKAWSEIKTRKAELLIYIPEDFSRKIKKGEQSAIRLWVNTANMATYGTSYPGLTNVVGNFNEQLSKEYYYSQGMPDSIAGMKIMPIDNDIYYLFHPTVSYGNFLVTGVLLVVIQQLVLIGFAFSIGWQREDGKYDTNSPYPFTYMLGKFFAQSLIYVLGVAFILLVIIPIFGWAERSLIGMFVVYCLFIITMLPVSMLVANLMYDKYASFQYLMFFSSPLFMISGFPWPFDQMPAYLALLGQLVPLTPAMQALRVASMKTTDFHFLLPHLVHMFILFVAYYALAIYIIGIRKKKSSLREKKIEWKSNNEKPDLEPGENVLT